MDRFFSFTLFGLVLVFLTACGSSDEKSVIPIVTSASPTPAANSDRWQPTAVNTSTPIGRARHTAIWTGAEMIVWGGITSLGPTNSGGRYDPASNAWSTTTTNGAAEPRIDHTAVWTGTEMIVWGGATALGSANTGGRYTPFPDAGSWANSPGINNSGLLQRRLHTAVWTGSSMLIWGGLTPNGLTSTGARYRVTTDDWLNISNSNAPAPRSGHSAVWSGSEMIIWGGLDANGLTSTGARYRPFTDSWIAISNLGAPSSRIGHTAIWTGNEMIVWGGTDSLGTTPRGARYNPTANAWTAIADAPAALSGHTAVWTGTEMIVWGGDLTFNNGYAYRPSSNTWRKINTTDTPTARVAHSAIWTGNQMIVWGGADNAGPTNTGGGYVP